MALVVEEEKMITLIDESVILRYVLNDDKRKSKEAAALISTGKAYTYPEILARVAVVLRDVYSVPRSQISTTMLLLLDDVSVSEEVVIRYATRLFGSSMLDYVDCLMIARNIIYDVDVLTFDKPVMKETLNSSNIETNTYENR